MISAVSGTASCVVTDTSNDIIIGGWGVGRRTGRKEIAQTYLSPLRATRFMMGYDDPKA